MCFYNLQRLFIGPNNNVDNYQIKNNVYKIFYFVSIHRKNNEINV